MKINCNKIELENGIKREWIISNGIGGFANQTILGINTRKYHGLLVAPLDAPSRRFVVLSKLDESITYKDTNEEKILYSNICKEYISNGYKNLDKIPDYRLLRGEVKAWNPYHGWIPVIFEDDIESITTHSASDTISSLLNVYDNSENRTAILPFNASMDNYLSKHGGFHTKYALMIGTNQIYNIIERVRNIILDRSIILE